MFKIFREWASPLVFMIFREMKVEHSSEGPIVFHISNITWADMWARLSGPSFIIQLPSWAGIPNGKAIGQGRHLLSIENWITGRHCE